MIGEIVKAQIIFNVNQALFNEIKSGKRYCEYRLANEYWNKRIVQIKKGSIIEFRSGYPSRYALDHCHNGEVSIFRKVVCVTKAMFSLRQFSWLPVEAYEIFFEEIENEK